MKAFLGGAIIIYNIYEIATSLAISELQNAGFVFRQSHFWIKKKREERKDGGENTGSFESGRGKKRDE